MEEQELIVLRGTVPISTLIMLELVRRQNRKQSKHGTGEQVNRMNDLISRQAAIDEIDEWIKAFRENGHKESAADACLIQDGIIQLPSAQPEQRYTEEELRVFAHGISLSLLSKRSAQHWRYDEDTATEIKFLERLYEKVVADIRGEQDE